MIKLENPLEAWMGDIPSEWKKIRLKYLFQIKKDIAGRNGITVLSVTQQGIIPKDMDAKGQFASDYSKYQTVDKGDFVMNHMDLLTGWVDISEYDGVTSPDYRVFECIESSKICAEYYKYLFQLCYKNRIFYGLGQGVSGFGRWRLPADMFLNFVLPVPDLSIQKRIAEYLYCNISGIDSVIESSKKTIQEYYELRNSIITEIITKGVNESKEYRETGKLWMPTIPSSYKLAKLKNLVDITDGTHDTPSYVDVGENTFPLVTSRCIEDGYINLVGKSMQTTRRFDALKVFMAFQTRGKDGFDEMITKVIDNADHFWSLIKDDPDFIVPVKPELSSVVFALTDGDEVNKRVRRRLLENGTVIGQTVMNGKVMLKFTLLNPNLDFSDFPALIETIKKYRDIERERA